MIFHQYLNLEGAASSFCYDGSDAGIQSCYFSFVVIVASEGLEDSCNIVEPPRKRCYGLDVMWEDAVLRQRSSSDLRWWHYIDRQIAVSYHLTPFSTFLSIMVQSTKQRAFRSCSAASCAYLDSALFYSCHSGSVANKQSSVISSPCCPCELEHFERGGQRLRASRGLLDWIVNYCLSVTLIHCWMPYWC